MAMKAKPNYCKKIDPDGSNLRWTSCYLLVSEDAREMAVVTMADAPQTLRDFVRSISAWVESMRKQVDAVDELIAVTDGEGIQ